MNGSPLSSIATGAPGGQVPPGRLDLVRSIAATPPGSRCAVGARSGWLTGDSIILAASLPINTALLLKLIHVVEIPVFKGWGPASG